MKFGNELMMLGVAGILAFSLTGTTRAADKVDAAADQAAQIQRGEYLTRITGCNDCHTAGYLAAFGEIPVDKWLLGDRLGWRGPWGTTYATNLRLFFQNFSEEEEWVEYARVFQPNPPMAWFNVAEFSDDDLKALFHFIKHLGPSGEPAPDYVAPSEEPSTPFVLFPSN